jgi:hypothetical protein
LPAELLGMGALTSASTTRSPAVSPDLISVRSGREDDHRRGHGGGEPWPRGEDPRGHPHDRGSVSAGAVALISDAHAIATN